MAVSAIDVFLGSPTEEQEREFWKSLRLPNRTFKTTTEKRLEDLNAAAIEFWRETGFAPQTVLDVAASSGVTTIEWLEAMRAAGFSPRMTATDISLNGKIFHLLPFYSVLVHDNAKQEPLQHIIFGGPLTPYFDYGIRSTLGAAITHLIYKPLRALRASNNGQSVRLVSPKVAAQAGITFIEDDLFDGASKERLGKFDVVRAANILNHGYFPEPVLRKALANLKSVLRGPGSCLIVVRTIAEGSNHGGIYRLTPDNRFELMRSVGQGSEIGELILAA